METPIHPEQYQNPGQLYQQATQPLTIRKMSDERAKEILQDLLDELGGIDPEDLTTFELNIIRKVAENPPQLPRKGCEEKKILK